MKKILLFLVLILTIGCTKKVDFNSMSYSEKASYKLNNMSLDEKIAQMLIIYYTGSNYDNLQSTIKEVKPGGFILMGENITTYDNTLNFVKSMQNDSDVPMFISIDQEGGKVQRLSYLTDVDVIQNDYVSIESGSIRHNSLRVSLDILSYMLDRR